MGSSWQAAFGFVLMESDQLCTHPQSPQPLFPPGNMGGFALVDDEELPVYSPDFCFVLFCFVFLCFLPVLYSSAPQPLDMNFFL